MNKDSRVEKIEELLNQEPLFEEEVTWQDQLQLMPVYKIPLKYLVYNKYNGRIKSRVKSLEKQGRVIDVASDDGRVLVEKLLWESKKEANEITKHDIEKYGQKIVGIVTRDGIIIDGNRRAMLLNKIDKFDYFKAVVLPIRLEENKREIRKLETSFQMGEDKKLDYNPIEKYLTIKDSMLEGDKAEEVAEWMGESVSKIKEWIGIMEVMDEYLDYLGYNGMYTQLDGREGQFVDFTKWLNSFYGGGSIKAFDGYKDSDVDDLKNISFDYIRAKYEGKRFRCLAQGKKENHFFGNRQIWESFRDDHFNNIEPIINNEDDINLDSENLLRTLEDRDEKFRNNSQELLDYNLDNHAIKLENIKEKDRPAQLVRKATDAIYAINKKSKDFKNPEVLAQLSELNKITTEMLHASAPEKILAQVCDLLALVKIKSDLDKKEDILNSIKNIEKAIYQLEKEIKHLK